ncbi:MAG: PAS domain-containing protein, partial [Thalassolituus sp.]
DHFCEISGFTREELIGRTHHIVNSGFHDRDFFKEMFQIIREEGIWRGEICNRRKNGELYWVETTISQLKDKNGEIEGYIALRTDVTDQHRTLEAMRRLHEITADRSASIYWSLAARYLTCRWLSSVRLITTCTQFATPGPPRAH